MNRYFSTFIPGLGEEVKNQLEKSLRGFICQLLLDGLIVYQSESSPEEIKKLRFLNNSFLEAKPEEKTGIKLGNTFRVIFSRENEIIAINRERLARIEKKIAEANHLTVDRSNPDFEFWFLERSEGYKFAGVRITKHPDYKDVLQKGQLRPELANLLCLISDPRPDDVVLDPFAGSGAIPAERANFPHLKIISGDIKTGTDALHMTEVADNSVNKIITDPPWGIEVGKELDLPKFYEATLKEFKRVLKPNGLVVVLMGNKTVFEEALNKASLFKLLKKYDVLVSGKKAAIYKLVCA
ncbi:hypothetical protein M1403_02590 [Patescibacteria group bacterium]|nr:hypothetical protein [Patescibacteria group bacterium]